MAPKFGTSGLRGLVTELTDPLVSKYVAAFLTACPHGDAVHVGWDLRPSSPRIADAVIQAVQAMGLTARIHGVLPTPALALCSMAEGNAAIMITGSHIPADRNGLKFYVPQGEISKAHEVAITHAFGTALAPVGNGLREDRTDALERYAQRYIRSFGDKALKGLKIGLYEHSSVARDVLGDILEGLGAEILRLARSQTFVPVDTEAVDPDTRNQLARWTHDHRLDALVSTDGDADRPMVTDANGVIVPGDLLGPLTARFLGAREIVTPVSSNTLVDSMADFQSVTRTQIGSPYVIAAMEARRARDCAAKTVGYEANGGFLLGFDATGPTGQISPLMTRDCLLPIVAPLAASVAAGKSLAELAADLPARFTAADRVQEVASDRSAGFIAGLASSADKRARFFSGLGREISVDETDGLRVAFDDGAIVHLRPSGNAPECRCYAEAGDAERAQALVRDHLAKLKAALT